MKKTVVALCLLLSSLAGWTQDQSELLRNFRNSWNGYAIQAELFDRYVKVNATPDWWAFLCSNRDGGYALVNLSRGVLDLAPGLGWADVKSLDDSMGSKGDAPPVLEALDSWKGKVSVTITLPPGQRAKHHRHGLAAGLIHRTSLPDELCRSTRETGWD